MVVLDGGQPSEGQTQCAAGVGLLVEQRFDGQLVAAVGARAAVAALKSVEVDVIRWVSHR